METTGFSTASGTPSTTGLGSGTRPPPTPTAPCPAPAPAPAPAPEPAPAAHACALNIHIDAHDAVHIHHHCGDGGGAPAPTPAPTPCPPEAPGNTCLPPVAGRKHKQDPASKLRTRAARTRAPSALAASTLHLVRRFLAGRPAANDIERSAFARLAQLPAAARSTLGCALARHDGHPADERERLFDPTLSTDVGTPLSPDAVTAAFGREIVTRASAIAYGEALAPQEERPGRIRVFEPGVEDFFSQVRICSINNLRTDDLLPRIPAGEYRPDEIAQTCQTVLVNGQPQVVCEVRTADCVGGQVDGVCLRVPTVAAGNGVIVQGVNYFSTDARVQLTARVSGSVRLVDGFVVGDIDTPVTETIDGQQRLINDCRVKDRLGFTVPEDLPPGVYDIQVVVPNITGIAAFGDKLLSNSEAIEVLPPPTARFQLSLETLRCIRETSPARFGSDEVGLRLLAVPLLADLSVGASQVSSRRFGDVDSGDSRNLGQLLFDQRAEIVAVALAVIGHEVDGEDAYANQVTAITDVFIDLVKEQAAFAKAALAAAGIGAKDLAKLGTTGIVVVAIAIAIVLAIDLIIALWAPADLIIEDPTGYTLLELIERTEAGFPMPGPSTFRTEGDIDVKVKPLDKLPHQYREAREYASSAEESRYEITTRFNRVA